MTEGEIRALLHLAKEVRWHFYLMGQGRRALMLPSEVAIEEALRAWDRARTISEASDYV